jgi:putative ABC transport system permease protein
MNTIKVAWYLAVRQLFRNNKKTVALIVFVMMLTFLNLVGASGILAGLIEGSSVEFRAKIIGDFMVSPLENKKVIQDSDQIISILKSLPEAKYISPRYLEQGTVESNYNKRDAGKRRELASMQIYGIYPSAEDKVTHLADDIIEGDYLNDNDTGKILLGKDTLGRYAVVPQDEERALGDVKIGDIVLVNIGGKVNEFVLKGVLKGKTDITRQGYMHATDLKKISGKTDDRATSIIVRVGDKQKEKEIKKVLVENGFAVNQKIETYDDAEPKFVQDLEDLFGIIGNVFGSIGIIVAVITIYIVIYINAVTKRKYIGILKGIGISPAAIELSYVFQSFFYGIIGSGLGAIIVYAVLVPFFNKNPIDFPFSDGILVAPFADTFTKFVILMFFTVLAGFLPARSIVKQNTLNAILGR